jgi:hypothetical protein
MTQTELEKELSGMSSDIQADMLKNVRRYKAEQKAQSHVKVIRDHILANMIKHTTFIDKNTKKERKSDKVELEKLCKMLNDSDPESPIVFKWHWQMGLFVDYGQSE